MQPSVVLVSMPWAPVQEPSLALGILKAQLTRDGIHAKVIHANATVLKYVTYRTYTEVAGYWSLNEFVFTELLSPGVDDTQLAALAERCTWHSEGSARSERYTTPEALLEMLLRFRGDVALDYLSEVAESVLNCAPTLVGLTCMFDQTMASVALAKLIKARSPETMVVLGGYALEGPPGEQVIKAFQWIDGVCRGDGEYVITPLARASVGQVDVTSIPGIVCSASIPVPAVKVDLRHSPDPDYLDWFDDVSTLKAKTDIDIRTGALPVESSRGCWWGQMKHCVFCGIDDETLRFRFKPAKQTVDMLHSMRSQYGDHPIRFSDYILPREYFKEVLPLLAEVSPRYRLHCEIKANQSAEAVASLARAGFEEVQPGIESFSTEVLKLMDKGVTAIQNVALLKYGYLERVVVHYNFIYGFPSEKAESYQRMVEQIPRLYHLMPPVSRSEAIITRFAPLHMDTTRFGVSLRPMHHRCYDSLFSKDFLVNTGFALDDYAYYFERYLEFSDEMSELYAQVVAQVNFWKRQHRERDVTLEYSDTGESLDFRDSRFCSAGQTLKLRGVQRNAYLACDIAPINVESLVANLSSKCGCTEHAVVSALGELDEARLVWRDGERIIGLAVPAPVARERHESRWKERWTAIYK
jgi:ribosomal peptide maturation radical SAM protein 1